MSDTTLHILNRGPNQAELLNHCLDSYSDGDALLFIEDGIYWAAEHYAEQLSQFHCFALKPDLEARGVSASGIQTVDDAGFVDLCINHSRSVSWN